MWLSVHQLNIEELKRENLDRTTNNPRERKS